MPSPDLNFLVAEGLAGDFADDAAGELGELGHVFAQILRFLLGALDELLQQLEQDRGAHDDLGLVLNAVGVEIVFRAGDSPAALVALRRHDHGMGAGVGMVAALLGALPAIMVA